LGFGAVILLVANPVANPGISGDSRGRTLQKDQ
jgi:hypothetical protein